MNLGDKPIGDVKCPKCGAPVVYNGNYFCSRWEFPYTGFGCNWALSHGANGEPVGRKDKAVWAQIQALTE